MLSSKCYFLQQLVLFAILRYGLTILIAKVCETSACRKLAIELQSIMNKYVDPCDDFSSYICGNFDKVYSIPPGEYRFSPLDKISYEIKRELKQLLG